MNSESDENWINRLRDLRPKAKCISPINLHNTCVNRLTLLIQKYKGKTQGSLHIGYCLQVKWLFDKFHYACVYTQPKAEIPNWKQNKSQKASK